MLEINGLFYYVDLMTLRKYTSELLDGLEDTLIVGEVEERKVIKPDGSEELEVTTKKHLNTLDSKFKTSVILDEFLRTVFSYKELYEDSNEVDDTNEQTSYKIAFNTLLINGIIKEYKI